MVVITNPNNRRYQQINLLHRAQACKKKNNTFRMFVLLFAFFIIMMWLWYTYFVFISLKLEEMNGRTMNDPIQQQEEKINHPSIFKEEEESNNNVNANAMTSITHLSTSERPVFIIHVGPPKTGSTTLQCTLESLRKELEQDNIAYIGRPECIGLHIDYKHKLKFRKVEGALTNFKCHKQLLDNEEKEKEISIPTCWQDFMNILDDYKEKNMNVFFSDEALANRLTGSFGYNPKVPYPWTQLQRLLDKKGFDLHFLTLHRPLHDYMVSAYNEIHKVGPNKIKLHRWPSHDDTKDNNINNNKCINQGGRKIPRPFDIEVYVLTIAGMMRPNQNLYPTPLMSYEVLLKHIPKNNITLIDMQQQQQGVEEEDGQDFVSQIICHYLPSATKTCKALQDTRKKPAQQQEQVQVRLHNPSIPLDYDMIAIEACEKGLINGTLFSRDFIRNSIRHQQEEVDPIRTVNDFALICPTQETLKQILDMSFDHEMKLRKATAGGGVTSPFSSFSWEETQFFNNSFWIAANEKKKFCYVNATNVVESEEWRVFFKDLKVPTT